MTLQATGPIKVSEVRTELGTSGTINLGATSARTLAGKAAGVILMSDFYGKTSAPILSGTLWKTLANPSPGIDDWFGQSVAISGNYAVVGSQNDDTGASNSGQAYIFDVTTGALLWTLTNPAPTTSDYFGNSVAISGNYAIVSAHFDDNTGSNSGRAYIFDVTTGALWKILDNPYPSTNGYFGVGVGLSGNYAIVGYYMHDIGATDSGSAYIFDVTTGAYVSTLSNPTPAATDRFGQSVAISGNYAIVGTSLDDTNATDSGSAYIFDVTTGTLLWTLANPTPAAVDNFGWGVGISGNYAIVSSHKDDTGATDVGRVYVFDVTTGALLRTLTNPAPTATDYFGYSVAISGNYAIIGAYLDDTTGDASGSAYIFDVTTGTLLKTLANPTPAVSDSFGISVAIDGIYTIVGANGDDTVASASGSAYIFK